MAFILEVEELSEKVANSLPSENAKAIVEMLTLILADFKQDDFSRFGMSEVDKARKEWLMADNAIDEAKSTIRNFIDEIQRKAATVDVKPVAWMCTDNVGGIMFSYGSKHEADPDDHGPWKWHALYTNQNRATPAEGAELLAAMAATLKKARAECTRLAIENENLVATIKELLSVLKEIFSNAGTRYSEAIVKARAVVAKVKP